MSGVHVAGGRRKRVGGVKQSSRAADVPRLVADAHACFLDIDGTLVELADSPERVRVELSLIRVLERLASTLSGAAALISGRRIADMDRLFAPLRLPSAGLHGLERRGASGSVHWHGPSSSEVPRMLAQARAWTTIHPGLLLEDKVDTFAVHFRQAPQLAEEVRTFLQNLMQQSSGDYCLQPGKMVMEVRPESRDKGTAVKEFMGEPPFAGRIPVFIGDDASDEQAFSVVENLGGVAIKVGPGETIARWRMNEVSEVRAWMGQCVATAQERTAKE